jgi:ferredoxin-NADP reductase
MIAEIIKVVQETPTVKTLQLKLPKPITFKPGQFIMIHETVTTNGKQETVKRAYSITSPPSQKNWIEITFNIIPGGKVSSLLFKKKKGEKLTINGPFGVFTFVPDTTTKEVIFVCGGTGITPFMCMLRNTIEHKANTRMAMIYSVRTPEDIIYKKELFRLAKEHNNFDLGITITREPGEWKGHTGRIDFNFIKEHTKNAKEAVFYVCGPPAFTQAIIQLLKGSGIKPENIKIEAWG